MRILFISAFYPPYVVGGWEQLVQDITVRLQARDHIAHVLTTTYGVDKPTREGGVSRLLTLESDLYHYKPWQFINHKGRLKRNLTYVEKTIQEFQPDIIFIHVMWNLSKGIAWLAEQLCPGRVVYYIANDWPYSADPHTVYWRDAAHNPVLRVAKRLLAPIPLKMIESENKAFAPAFQHVLCVSQAVKNDLACKANILPPNMRVIYNGVETDCFVPPVFPVQNGSQERGGLKLLYAGSLVPHKGVHTAIEAMAVLGKHSALGDISLTIVGAGHPEYETRLRQMVDEANLQAYIHFIGRVPREEMSQLLQKFNVLIFPSIWEEPLARIMQEAMAAGLVVIGTLTGGTGELLIEGETGLTFDPGDAKCLAKRITQLLHDGELCTRLTQNAREKVVHQFDIRRMIDEIEAYLLNVTQETPHFQERNS